MKYLYTLVMVALYMIASAQSDTAITYTAVVKIDSVTKATTLYERARLWIASAYQDSKAVLEIQDKEVGQLVGKGTMQYTPENPMGSGTIKGWVKYTIKIFVKEGRYKYEFTGFTHSGSSAQGYPPIDLGLITSSEKCPEDRCSYCGMKFYTKTWNDIKNDIDTHIKGLVASLNKAMSDPANGKTDW